MRCGKTSFCRARSDESWMPASPLKVRKNVTRPGEDELIARYFAPLAAPGGLALLDDTAIYQPPAGCDLVLTKDALVAGVHFFVDDAAPRIAQKALRVNLSDLAAKAAEPAGFLLALALPRDWTPDWLKGFADGLGEDAAAFGCALFGGDTVMTPGPLCLSITAFGIVPTGALVRRTGVREGDQLYVTGTIGDAALGLRICLNKPADQSWIAALSPGAREHLINRYLLPEPRLSLRHALQQTAHAGMDVSDGFVGDMAKMMRASRVSGEIDLSKVPFSKAAAEAIASFAPLFDTALTGGDDYELMVSVSSTRAAEFEQLAAAAGVPVRAVGRAVAGRQAPTFIGRDGRKQTFASGSYSHF
jgi:thiamine-monophosphate kinase